MDTLLEVCKASGTEGVKTNSLLLHPPPHPKKRNYPLSTLPEHIHSTIFCTPKLPVKHTHNPKKIVSIPLTLVPSLANYHSLYSPPSLGVSPSLTQTCHSSFWRRSEWSLCGALLTFVHLPSVIVSKLPVFILPLFIRDIQ